MPTKARLAATDKIDAARQDDDHLRERQHEQEAGVGQHADQAFRRDEDRRAQADGDDQPQTMSASAESR